MKRNLFLVILMLLLSLHSYSFNANDAKELASNFHKLLVKLSSDIYTEHMPNDKSDDLEQKAKELCYDGDCRMPDEIKFFKKESPAPFKTSNGYIRSFSEYAMENGNMLMSFNVGECITESNGPTREKDLSISYFYYVTVFKNFTIGETTCRMKNEIVVDGTSGKIIGIGNRDIGGFNVEYYTGDDYKRLQLAAARAYNQGKYDEAYNTYLKMTHLKPDCCEPYYKMALMIFFKKGIKGRFKSAKERNKTMRDYLYRANHNKGDVNYDNINKDAYYLWYTTYNGLV